MEIAKNTYTLLVSCPSDIKDEILIVKDVVNEWNAGDAGTSNCFLKFVYWKENSYPQYGGIRAQAIVNEQIVSSADIIVGIFGTRFGTNTGVASSGTEEEIRKGIELEKDIMMYFIENKTRNISVNNEDHCKIEEFKEEYQKKGLYWTVSNTQEFREIFKNHLKQVMDTILNRVGNATYLNIISCLRDIFRVDNICYDYINNHINVDVFQNALSLFNYNTTLNQIDSVPIKNRDSIEYIYNNINFIAGYIKDLEVNPTIFLATRFSVSSKVLYVGILSWFVLTKPKKIFMYEVKSLFKKCYAFKDKDEFSRLSFINGQVGWKANQIYEAYLQTYKTEGIKQEALDLKNKSSNRNKAV